MTRQVHILEVTLRFAVVANDKRSAVDVVKETMNAMNDGSLSDMHVYEWDDPAYVRAEETDTQ